MQAPPSGPVPSRIAIERQPHGWKATTTGAAGFFVGNTAVTESTFLRSGDVVRLSPLGPDFQFCMGLDPPKVDRVIGRYVALPAEQQDASDSRTADIPADNNVVDAAELLSRASHRASIDPWTTPAFRWIAFLIAGLFSLSVVIGIVAIVVALRT
ncbi:MAG: hypothetical protein AAF958_14420 [Planctomycetota bacterium]